MLFDVKATVRTLDDHLANGSAPASGTSPESGNKQRAAIHRDVVWLLDELAPERPLPKSNAPVSAIQRHRSPGRCILQGAVRAVSVSWFPGQQGSDALGELVIIIWSGTVSIPGSTRKTTVAAKPLETLLLHPVAAGDRWEWQASSGGRRLMTSALAARCLKVLEE